MTQNRHARSSALSDARKHHLLNALETALRAGEQDRHPLFVCPRSSHMMQDLTLAAITRLPQGKRLLVLAGKKERKETFLTAAKSMASLEQVTLTDAPRDFLQCQVCLATVFDIQVQIGVEASHPFFQQFDVLLVYGIPDRLGPTWYHVLELFAATGTTQIIGLSEGLHEESSQLFDPVITGL